MASLEVRLPPRAPPEPWGGKVWWGRAQWVSWLRRTSGPRAPRHGATGHRPNAQHRAVYHRRGGLAPRGPTRRVPDPARGKRIKPREPRTQRAATDWQGGSEPTSSNRHSIIEWKGTGVLHPQTPVRLVHRPLGDNRWQHRQPSGLSGRWSISNVVAFGTRPTP